MKGFGYHFGAAAAFAFLCLMLTMVLDINGWETQVPFSKTFFWVISVVAAGRIAIFVYETWISTAKRKRSAWNTLNQSMLVGLTLLVASVAIGYMPAEEPTTLTAAYEYLSDTVANVADTFRSLVG